MFVLFFWRGGFGVVVVFLCFPPTLKVSSLFPRPSDVRISSDLHAGSVVIGHVMEKEEIDNKRSQKNQRKQMRWHNKTKKSRRRRHVGQGDSSIETSAPSLSRSFRIIGCLVATGLTVDV